MSMRVRRAPRRRSTRPGKSAHRYPRCLARRRSDLRSDPNQHSPTPDALSHMPAMRVLCCADSSDCRRTCAMSGLDAGATKNQLTAVRGLLRRAEASRHRTSERRTPHAKAPGRRVSPDQNDSAWERQVGRVGLEPISVTPLTCEDAETTDTATRFHPAAIPSIPPGWESVGRRHTTRPVRVPL